MRELSVGAEIAGYRIERRLGAGGMGVVYLARHPRLPRLDALKVLAYGSDSRFRERFRREARLASRLDHPNVVSIYNSGENDEMLWIAMQFVDGRDAADLVSDGGLAAERAITIVTQAARGLDAAHAADLLHRDVKPANLLVAADGRVLVTDFGIARETGDSETLAAGLPSATLAYAAPEQIRGAPVDHRADVYGLGATLYHLVTGQVPYPRETAAAMVHAQLSAPPPRPSRIAPTLPTALDAVIARALAKDPAHRYHNCGELAEAARATLGGRTLRHTRRIRRTAAALAAAATVAATVVAFGLTDHGSQPAAPAAGPAAPPSTTAASTTPTPVSPWGNAAFIASAFPTLFPSKPSSRAYLGLTCTVEDDPATPSVVCTGNNVTVSQLTVTCRTDRATFPAITMQDNDEGTENWGSGTSSGTAVWRTVPNQSGDPIGNLEIRFNNPDRNFCALTAHGTPTGQGLYEGWWKADLI